MIKATGLSKRYGDFEALKRFSLEVSPGEIVALVGPNGAGKTTAIKLLVGLLAPSQGDVWIGGHHVIRQAPQAKQMLAYIPDQPFLYESLTLAELIGFVGGVYRMNCRVLEERAQALLEVFGLSDRLQVSLGSLSYGMKSRVCLLLGLLHDPKAFILDEPFFGLDPATLRLVKQLLTQRAREGMAIFLSTHQLAIVEDLAHRIMILSGGDVVASGTWKQLHERFGGTKLEDVFFELTGPKPAGENE